MDKNKISDIAITMSSLYELLFNIGQSFDIQENAEAFLRTLMLQKNLSFAAYYTCKIPNRITKVHSIPKTALKHYKLDDCFLQKLIPRQLVIFNDANENFSCIAQLTKLKQKEFVVFFAGSKSIIVLGKKSDSFNRADLTKTELVLNRFGFFMESLESHRKIKDEIKIKAG